MSIYFKNDEGLGGNNIAFEPDTESFDTYVERMLTPLVAER